MQPFAVFARKERLALLFFAFTWCACTPASVPSAPTPEPAPGEEESGPSAIPWAEGERPVDGEATTREVAEQPPSADDPMILDDEEDGGITSADTAGSCTGRVPNGLLAMVQARAARIKSCGSHLPEGHDEHHGGLKFNVRVQDDGQVASVTVLSDSLANPKVKSCAEKILREPFDVAPEGGCAMFLIPLVFDAERTEQVAPAKPAP